MIHHCGPTESDLHILHDWAKKQGLSGSAMLDMLQQTLSGLNCGETGNVILYSDYFHGLLAGKHDISRLELLSLPALQQVARVLLAWRQWLESQATPPACLDHLLLECVAAAQASPLATAHRAGRDLLTGLPDQTVLPHVLELCLQRTAESSISALLYLEIAAGPHVYPDALLQITAQRLTKLLRPQDALLLINRQAFALVLANLHGEGHALLAAHRALSCFDEAIALSDQTIHLHPRIGIALAPEHGQTAEQLLAASVKAAREHGTDGIGVYDPQRDRLTFSLKRLEIPLRNALQNNLFHLAFQPQIDCRTHRFWGMESLLRWQDDTLGAVRPDEVVMVAEQLGLMGSLTHWILNASLREYAKLLKTGIPGTISINLSPGNLLDKELPSVIQNALAVWQVPPQRLILEVTESALIENLDEALDSLHGLKRLGCKLALDDFGTGYSSLSYLKRLPIDELKIDRSFIVAMRESTKDANIVRTIIELAHLLEMHVVAEGVEDEDTLRLLADMNTDVIQGYCFSKPLGPTSIPAFIATLQ